MNTLYYGDNLDILQRYIPDASVDLVYLDPPFNSNASYNVLFAERDGSKAASQIRAFEDTWTWDHEDESVYADRGIDGKVVFQSGAAGTFAAVLISVKAGKTTVAHVRDLVGVLDREKAAIGVLITMEDPTAPMRTEAATAGFYDCHWGRFPRLQLLTIADLLAGRRIEMPPQRQVSTTFKRATRETAPAPIQPTLPV